MALALETAGHAALLQRDPHHATADYGDALRLFQAMGDRAGTTVCLEGLAAVAVQQNQPERAAWLSGAAAGLRAALGAPQPPVDRALYAPLLATVRVALGEDAFAAAWEAGRALLLEQAMTVALTAPEPRS